MRFNVPYGFFFANHVYCVFPPCVVVQFVSSAKPYVCTAFSPSPSLPSLVDSVSIGLVSISTDLVSVMVSGGWLLLSELPWIPAHALLKACV